MRQLKFGVEIEFFNVERNVVANGLQLEGVTARVEGYNHDTKDHWKLTTDSSVTSKNCFNSNGSGNEIVSPILYEDEGLDELEVVLYTLRQLGAKVDKSCGLHIHHDVADYTLENFKSLYNFMYAYRNVIDAMMPASRRNIKTNVQYDYCKGLTKSDIESINQCDSLNEIKYAIGTRYKTLNIQSYLKYGTIEFRQHSGSVEDEKVVNWIVITHMILAYCKENVVAYKEPIRGNILNATNNMLTLLGMENSKISEYVINRINKLSVTA